MAVSREVVYTSYSGSRDSLEAEVHWKIPWSNIDALYLELFPGSISGFPVKPELLAGSSALYADSITFEPFVGSDDAPDSGNCATAVYDYALAKATYRTIPYEQQGDSGSPSGQLITRSFDCSAEILTLPSHGLKWALDGQLLNDPDLRAGKIVPLGDISIHLHRVTPSYFATLQTKVFQFIGCVNNATFEGAAAGTLLLLGGSFRQTVSADGSKTWECEVKFQYKAQQNPGGDIVGWNYFFRPDVGSFRLLTRKDDELIYAEKDFSELYV